MNDKGRQTRRLGLVRVGVIWFILLIGLWLFLPSHALGAEGNAVPLPHGAIARLGTGRIMAVKYSPDGNYLAVTASLGIELYDAHTLKFIRLFSGRAAGVNSVAFSPDGKMLASGSVDNTIKLWDVETGSLIRTLTCHKAGGNSVVFSPDGEMLASGSTDGAIELWDAKSGSLIRTLTGYTGMGNVLLVAFSPDGRMLASGSTEGTIELWDVNSGSLIRTLTGYTGMGDVLSVAFSPDGKTVASGSTDSAIELWDVKTGSFIRTLTGHTDAVTSVAFSPDGMTLASSSQDNTVLIWDVKGILNTNERKAEAPGVQFVLQPQGIDEMSPALRNYVINHIITVLTNRVHQYGIANAEIKCIGTTDMGTNQIFVNLPGVEDSMQAQIQARILIEQTGMLEVMKVVQAGTSPNEDLTPASLSQEVLKDRRGIPYIVNRQPLLTNAALSNAQARTSQWIQNAGQLFVVLTLNPKGAQQFVDTLRQLKVGDRLAIVLDDVIYSTPLITQTTKDEAARGWQAVQNSIAIQGPFTSNEATRIAVVLRSGVLPVPVNVVRESPL